ncbi:uncharacterized protein FIBRA_06749 [Fibroporia radiculosa]|uniref:Secreted protein n=1 Tax=Fibroporia radiculosa TaxID=599839 RepID=J4GCE2_9APHY|nr:uncharacterized protein FIBRA_06749 [Fibroporia radiculosa]CCM04568.1 predicted protein [Fibroporia radiculosa]
MPAFQIVFAVFLALVPFVQPLPIPIPRNLLQQPSPVEPGTLLGRRYSLQNHALSAAVPTDNNGQPVPRYHPSHASPRRRYAPFPKYLAERAVAEHTRSSEGKVAPTSHVRANVAEQTSSSSEYNTSVTLVPRPTAAVEANHSETAKPKRVHKDKARTVSNQSPQ